MLSPILNTARKRLILAVALVVPVFTMSGASSDLNNANCTLSKTSAGQVVKSCVVAHAANNSWYHWLTGESRSAQFVFIDLFELVYSNKKDTAKVVLNAREG